jgi:gamma-glutamyltranspeptidase/glutathione hydrolase
MGRSGVVSSGHYLASLAGIRVLQEGGNAVDAALATSFVLSVVIPDASGPGGDLFALVHMKKSGKVEALNASGAAPGRATIEMFRGKGLKQVPTSGPLSIAVPGAVDGWTELHRKYGTLELSRLAADAIGYARDGFPISRRLAQQIGEMGSSFPWIDRAFRKPLGDLTPGKMLAQEDLARTFEQIVKSGREGFYNGELGARMCAAIQAEGGLIGQEDLQGRHAEWLDPLTSTYRDYLLFEQPPVSQGFLVLEMLNIIEGYPLEQMEPVDVAHVMIEAKKLAFEDRINHLEDPRFGDPQISRLISKEHAGKRRGLISSTAKARESLPGSFGADTTYLCAADRDGNVVSLIQSIFAHFGSRVVAGDTGMVMNNRLCSFVLDPARANSLKPGKRPAHTLNSYLVFRNGEFLAVGGTPGNDDQPQSNMQILHRLLDLGMDPQTAIEAPRWSHSPGTPPRLELPEELSLEEGFPPDLIEGLRGKGHKVKVVGRWSFGAAEVIVRDPMTGSWMAGADPRREGYAIAW